MTHDELADYVLEALEPLGVSARRRFGALHLYLDGVFFGFISAEGRLYLRTDDASRPAFIDRGMTAFQPPGRPRGPRTVDRNFEVPPEVTEEPALLREWAARAARAGR